MKNYRTYEKQFIGESNCAALVAVGMKPEAERAEGAHWMKTQPIAFGEDGAYMARVVDEEAEIPSHYKLEATFAHWMKIYDDNEMTFSTRAKEIRIYQAGSMGTIIQLIGAANE